MFLRDPIVKEMAEIIIKRCPKDEDGDFEEGFLNYPCKWDTINVFNETTVSIGFNSRVGSSFFRKRPTMTSSTLLSRSVSSS